jgi:hypothetical protein
MTLIIVSELHKVKYPKRFARMPSTETGAKTPANKRAGADPHPYLKESLPLQEAVVSRVLFFLPHSASARIHEFAL